MVPLFKRFVVRTLLLTLAVSVAGSVVFLLLLPRWYSPVMPFLLIFFFSFTILTFFFIIREDNLLKFTRFTIIITYLRLMVYTVVTLLCLLFTQAKAAGIVLTVGVLYLIYTFWETMVLSRVVRQKQNRGGREDPGPEIKN